jgi:cytochrome c553
MNGQPLSEEEIQRIAHWIDHLGPAGPTETAKDSKKLAWPWTPVTEPQVPPVKYQQWVKNPIDAFVMAQLEKQQLEPALPVSPRGWLRRLYFSLIGLPPTPEAMKQFLADPSPEAYRQQVEMLLADSRYGEHWGRHWLDLARYSDTRGGAIDDPQPHLWRYRDYVIRAFNQDRPYDRFIKEQLAGDVFRGYGDEAKLGLAFLGLWVKVEAQGQQGRRDYITDVVNTTGSVFMGLTLGCAQCHDHKYDPLPQKDYFRIEAFFSPASFERQDLPFHQYEMPLQQPERWEVRKKDWKDHLERVKKNAEAFKEKLSERAIEHQLLAAPQDLKDWAHADQKKIPVPKDTLRSAEERQRLREIDLMTGRFANPNVDGYYDPKAYVVRDSSLQHTIATYVLTGGNWRLRGEQVQPGFLSAITGNSDPVNLDGLVGSRRQLMAKWIANRDHPLTARVMVNRIWQYHFGRGLVATPSDFGANGSGTVHQDLIDWLAWEFMESGWSIKQIHRLILNSNVYRQSMTHPRSEQYEKVDPNNRYLWVRDSLRIEAEPLRDSILAVSGQLNPAMGGPPFFPEENLEQMARAGTWWVPSNPEEVNRRTVYMIQSRSYPIPLIKVFDGPNLDESCVVRGNTTVTPQVFSLFNGKFPHQQSRAMAQRIIAEVGQDPLKQIARAFQLAFQRDPSPTEKTKSLAFLGGPRSVPKQQDRFSLKQVALVQGPEESQLPGKDLDETGSLSELCLILINMNEFIYLE